MRGQYSKAATGRTSGGNKKHSFRFLQAKKKIGKKLSCTSRGRLLQEDFIWRGIERTMKFLKSRPTHSQRKQFSLDKLVNSIRRTFG